MDGYSIEELRMATFKTMLKHSKDMIFMKDLKLRYCAASRPFLEMIGLKTETDIIGKTDFQIFPEVLAKKYTEDDRRILSKKADIVDYIEPLPDQNGRRSYSSTSKHIVWGKQGEMIGLLGISIDATAKMELEAERERNNQSIQIFDSILEADLTDNKVLMLQGEHWANAKVELSTYTFSDMTSYFIANHVKEEYQEECQYHLNIDKLEADFENGIVESCYKTLISNRGDGTYRWIECIIRLFRSKVSHTLRITVFFRDINEEVCQNQYLQRKANTDALTGLCNRENALQEIITCLEESHENQLHALMFIDLDSFKQINDSWGHPFGDKVLISFSEKLRSIFRDKDILSRIGGDEFMVFLKDIPSREVVEDRAKRTIEMLSLCYKGEETFVQITCSVGVVLCRGNQISVTELYDQADQAMYRAKQRGRNCYIFYDDSLREK